MYLSKIEILGFKSFANKTSLNLDQGVTAIVGPNGCGKTNIVDALRWALGEQRYSTLRSDKMEDIIFNGTKNRKPLGLAEVSLTIQNNKGVLPVDYDELTVTRRIFRSGESEYLLNRNVTRLKDIVSLFMDTGMGSNAYSVIELKMIDSILSEKVEERRKLFEEAAGVTKYKAKRKEALRRLADVEADLVRVDDIISEVTKAVNSLHRQAKKAERYNEFMELLRKLEIEVLQRDFNGLHMRLEPLQEKRSSSFSEREAQQHRIKDFEALLHVLRVEEREFEGKLDQARQFVSDLDHQISEREQTLGIQKERARSLENRIVVLNRDKENYSRSIETNAAESERSAGRAKEIEVRIGELTTEFDAAKEVQHEHEQSLLRKRQEANALQSERMAIVQETTRLHGEIERREQRIAAIQTTLERLDKEDQEAQERAAKHRAELAEQETDLGSISQLVIDAERTFHDMEERKQVLKTEIDQLQAEGFELQGKIGEKMTRMDFLTGLIDRLEGYNESVQHLLRNRDWIPSPPPTIADLVTAPDHVRRAVEAGLHESASYVVVRDHAEAVSGLLNLRENRKGKATFVCLNRVPKVSKTPPPITGEGVIGWALDLVQCEQEYVDLFRYLLRDKLIVRDSDTARSSLAEYPSVTCITLDGDVFENSGLVRGGSHSQDEGSMIGKRDQIAALQREVVRLQEKLQDNQELLSAKNDEYNKIDLRVLADNIKRTQQDLSASERRTAQMMFEIERNERSVQKNAIERNALQEESTRALQQLGSFRPQLEERSRQKEELENKYKAEQQQLAELEESFNAARAKVNELNVQLVRSKGEQQNLEREISRLRNAHDDALAAIDKADSEMKAAESSIASLQDDIRQSEETLERLREEWEKARSAASEIEEQLKTKRAEIESREALLQNERQAHGQTVSLVHEIEMKIGEIQHHIQTLEQQAIEEYELTLLRAETQEEDVFDLGQAKEEIRDLKMKIKSIGLVNPLAFEEWQKEKDRLEVLTAQHKDLVEAQKTLVETIQEINHTAQEKFISTFAQVRENFITIFKSLFDEGDEADLLLEESDDPLESKIEIVAKPRGKRPHSIDMLSGGEKTLTAIALLFGIYLVKPSPFCILDEVDAPLDDANIGRFVRILRTFSNNTQFIVVTHNKLTMEAADTLFGVTMEEEGISKLVSVKFNDKELARFMN